MPTLLSLKVEIFSLTQKITFFFFFPILEGELLIFYDKLKQQQQPKKKVTKEGKQLGLELIQES